MSRDPKSPSESGAQELPAQADFLKEYAAKWGCSTEEAATKIQQLLALLEAPSVPTALPVKPKQADSPQPISTRQSYLDQLREDLLKDQPDGIQAESAPAPAPAKRGRGRPRKVIDATPTSFPIAFYPTSPATPSAPNQAEAKLAEIRQRTMELEAAERAVLEAARASREERAATLREEALARKAEERQARLAVQLEVERVRAEKKLEVHAEKMRQKHELAVMEAELKVRLRHEMKEKKTHEQKKEKAAEYQRRWREKKARLEQEEQEAVRLALIDDSLLTKAHCASGYVGVFSYGRKWRSRVPSEDGRGYVSLGAFTHPQEAAWERYNYLKDRGLPTGDAKSVEFALLAKKHMPHLSDEALQKEQEETQDLIEKAKLGWQLDPMDALRREEERRASRTTKPIKLSVVPSEAKEPETPTTDLGSAQPTLALVPLIPPSEPFDLDKVREANKEFAASPQWESFLEKLLDESEP